MRTASSVAPNVRPNQVWQSPTVVCGNPCGTVIEYVLPCPPLLIRSV